MGPATEEKQAVPVPEQKQALATELVKHVKILDRLDTVDEAIQIFTQAQDLASSQLLHSSNAIVNDALVHLLKQKFNSPDIEAELPQFSPSFVVGLLNKPVIRNALPIELQFKMVDYYIQHFPELKPHHRLANPVFLEIIQKYPDNTGTRKLLHLLANRLKDNEAHLEHDVLWFSRRIEPSLLLPLFSGADDIRKQFPDLNEQLTQVLNLLQFGFDLRKTPQPDNIYTRLKQFLSTPVSPTDPIMWLCLKKNALDAVIRKLWEDPQVNSIALCKKVLEQKDPTKYLHQLEEIRKKNLFHPIQLTKLFEEFRQQLESEQKELTTHLTARSADEIEKRVILAEKLIENQLNQIKVEYSLKLLSHVPGAQTQADLEDPYKENPKDRGIEELMALKKAGKHSIVHDLRKAAYLPPGLKGDLQTLFPESKEPQRAYRLRRL